MFIMYIRHPASLFEWSYVESMKRTTRAGEAEPMQLTYSHVYKNFPNIKVLITKWKPRAKQVHLENLCRWDSSAVVGV